jgi:hypothetical protein
MHRRDLAVCTRALTATAYFKVWYDYYSRQVGAENLYVISISPEPDAFAGYKLGGIINLQSYPYDERQKAGIFQHMLGLLLRTHRYAIICDVDEIMVPDPAKYTGLLDFITKDTRAYYTPYGYNLLHYGSETELDLDKPILIDQRSHARFVSPMCKTCFTSVEFRVTNTFHYTELYPSFRDLFLFHLKHADMGIETQWGTDTRNIEFVDPTRSEHHNRTAKRVENFKVSQERVGLYPEDDAFPQAGTIEKLLEGAYFDPGMKIYRWNRLDEDKVARIPDRFRGTF